MRRPSPTGAPADRPARAGRSLFAAAARVAAALLLLCGCRAVDVGAPVVERQTRTIHNTACSPSRSEVTAVKMTHAPAGAQAVSVGLVADVREEYERTSHEQTTTITKQRRLSFGFFPAAAEQYCAPVGADPPACFPRGYPAAFAVGLPFVPLGTLHALLLEGPFGSYDCTKSKNLNAYAHVGLLGIHKYTVSVREGPVDGPFRAEPPHVRTRTAVAVPGPFEIEFSIPDLGHRPAPVRSGRDGTVVFSLPAVTRDRTVRAFVSFRPVQSPAAASEPWVGLALGKAAAESHSFDVTLRAPPPPKPPPAPTVIRIPVSVSAPASTPAPTPPQRPYKVTGIQPGDGGFYTVCVEILDTTRTFDIRRLVEAEVRDLVRQDFLSRHPGESPQTIRENLRFVTENAGRTLMCEGRAFSARPVEDGWHYDPESRRGWVRLRITGGMPAAEAKSWARDNISAIVAEKNVALEVGKAPPPGATYRSRQERFEDGLLTVEFEALQ